MFDELDLAKRSITQLPNEIVLVKLVFKALDLQKRTDTFQLELLSLEVQKSRSARRDVGLHGVEDSHLSLAIFGLLSLGQAQMAFRKRVANCTLTVRGSLAKLDRTVLDEHVVLLEPVALRP